MADLMKLLKTTIVQKYHEDFDALITQRQLSEEHTLSCFLGGLKKDIQMMVRMFQSSCMQKGVCLGENV